MKRRTIPWVIALFFLAAFSCDKNKPDPECKDASCCHPEYNEYVEYIMDEPALLMGPPQFSNWAIRVTTGYPTGSNNAKSNLLDICESSLDKIQGFVPEIDTAQGVIYRYRVSGKVLSDVKNPRLVATPLLSISIDKIEKIK
ncbi:hypothetical protein [Dyadobacter pollutisoli]|jgi:hypothetical protein|uniref:Lipoprotein n=1 Tax=Dyadobacter pollutisoli TaxID=2910158 RepID=A0A9E8SMV3_9BACT|nr:hypothetical protein [Dyadobacter pollutisoli]WAC10157.1 hypothetical protein ON006_20635 [Dyadobacter pollutisoli]